MNSQKIAQLQEQNQILQSSLAQLNSCYQMKIQILEDDLESVTQKYEKSLITKRDDAQRMAKEIGRYQHQVRKLINLVESLSKCFEDQKENYKQQLCEKQEKIAQLTEARQYDALRFKQLTERYTPQINRLKQQLAFLRDEEKVTKQFSSLNTQQADMGVLRDISYTTNHIRKQQQKNKQIIIIQQQIQTNDLQYN